MKGLIDACYGRKHFDFLLITALSFVGLMTGHIEEWGWVTIVAASGATHAAANVKAKQVGRHDGHHTPDSDT